jgi:hypothetical protein
MIPEHIYHCVYPNYQGNTHEVVFIYKGESHRSSRYLNSFRKFWWVDMERIADNRPSPMVHADSGIKRYWLRKGIATEVQPHDLPIFIGMTRKYPAWDRFFGREIPDGNPISPA